MMMDDKFFHFDSIGYFEVVRHVVSQNRFFLQFIYKRIFCVDRVNQDIEFTTGSLQIYHLYQFIPMRKLWIFYIIFNTGFFRSGISSGRTLGTLHSKLSLSIRLKLMKLFVHFYECLILLRNPPTHVISLDVS